MTRVRSLIAKLKDWTAPRKANHRGRECPFLLATTLAERGASDEMLAGLNVDTALREFWLAAESAELFKDSQFAQWGLRILSPSEAQAETERQRASRPDDFSDTDLVIGRFIGDGDLLVTELGDAADGKTPFIVALPLYPREEWPVAARSFDDFLENLLGAEGDKYWEDESRRQVH